MTDLLTIAAEPGLWDQAMGWMMAQQRQFHRELASALRTLVFVGSAAAVWGMVMVSFLYGVFHAAGPGHGKAVIATYLLTHENHVRRGVWLAFASAMLQGAVAVIIVCGLVLAAQWLPYGRQDAVSWSERLSFAMLAGMGALFVWQAMRGLLRGGHGRDHDHDGHHHDDHVHGPHCNHGPTPQQIAEVRGIGGTIGILFSVGLRPCSGAILVLALANALGLVWAGIASVLAMSLGTALTVAVLALLAVKARGLAASLFGGQSPGYLWVGRTVALAGGLAIFVIGASLLKESFGPGHPLLF